MRAHKLKCWPGYFEALWSGAKTFELRKDDRGYAVGDELDIHEWDTVAGYSGRSMRFDVTYLLRGAEMVVGSSEWLQPGIVCMGLSRYPVCVIAAAPAPSTPSSSS